MSWSNKSIRQSLLFYEVVSLVLLVAILLTISLLLRDRLIRAEQDIYNQNLSTMNHAINENLSNQRTLIDVLTPHLAQEHSLAGVLADKDPALEMVYELSSEMRVDAIYYTRDRNADAFLGFDLSHSQLAPYIQQASTSRQAVMSPVSVSFFTGKASIYIFVSYAGKIYAYEQNFQQIMNLLASSALTKIYDKNLVMLQDPNSKRIFYSSSNDMLPSIDLSQVKNRQITLDGHRYFVYTQLLEERNLQVVVLTPASYYNRFLRIINISLLLLWICVILLFAILHFWINRALAEPLTQLHSSIYQSLTHELNHEIGLIDIRSSYKEWRAIEAVYNEMVVTLTSTLHQNQELNTYLTAIMNSVPDAVFIYNADKSLVFANRTALLLYQYSDEELRQHAPSTLDGNGGDYAPVTEMFYDVLHNGHEREMIWKGKTKSGSIFPVQLRLRRIIIDQTPMVLSVVTDLTEHEEAKNALQQKTEELDRYFAYNLDLLCISDREARFVRFNPEWEKTLGYSREELLKLTAFDLIHPDDLISFQNSATKLSQHQPAIDQIHRFRHADGHYVWLEWRAYPSDERLFIVARDVSERRRQEQALIESEERFRSIITNTPNVSVTIIDRQGKIVFWNHATEELFGYTEAETIDQILGQLFLTREQGQEYLKIVAEVDQTLKPYGPAEWVCRHRSGQLRYVFASIFPLLHSNQDTLFVAMNIDITERRLAEEALRASEQRLRSIIDSSPFGAHVFDLDENDTLILTSYNRAADEILHYHHEDFLNHPISEIITNIRQRPKILQKFIDIAQHGGSFSHEYIISDHVTNQIKRCYGIHAFSIGERRICILFTDTTEKRLSEERVAEARALMDGAFSVSPEGIIVFSADSYKILYINPAGRTLLGFPSDSEHLGQTMIDFRAPLDMCHTDDSPYQFEEFPSYRVIHKAERIINELVHIGFANEPKRWLLFNGAPIYNHDGKLVAGVLVFPDITALREVQEALSKEKETLAVTLRSIGDGVIATDTEGKVVLLNREAELMTGWKLEEALGKPLESVFRICNERTRKECENPVAVVLRTGQIEGLANGTILIAKNGEERMIADSAAPIRDKDSSMRGIVLVFRDVTTKNVMERELQKAQKLESVGILAGGIAHDFNNILMAILGNISMVKFISGKDERVVQMLIEAEKACLRARGLTQQLLTFAKGGNPVKETVSINELIRESSEFVLSGSNVTCVYAFDDSLYMADIDSGQISQVVQNLVLNAKQAMPMGGQIEIGVHNREFASNNPIQIPPGKYLQISVTDHGVGIPKENLGKIFDPYFTTKETGSGLGLSVCYSVIRKHDGLLTVNSEEQQGTTFTIYLPAAAREQISLAETAERYFQGEGRILLMEDDPHVQMIAGRMLERFGYTVTLASKGEIALELYQQAMGTENAFRLVIMDLTIRGGMGGREAIDRLLQLDPQAKAIVASGYSNDPVMADYRQFGFSGVLTKPFEISEMSRVIHEILNS